MSRLFLPEETMRGMRNVQYIRHAAASACLLVSFLVCPNVADAGQVSFSETDFPKEREVVRRLLQNEIQDAESLTDADRVTIKIAVEDLNIDGKKDIIAYIEQYPFFCGTMGCRIMVLIADKKGGWMAGLDDLIAHDEIQVLDKKTNGYLNLLVEGKLELVWGGRKYVTK